MCVHSMQLKKLELDHLIFAPSVAAKSDTFSKESTLFVSL